MEPSAPQIFTILYDFHLPHRCWRSPFPVRLPSSSTTVNEFVTVARNEFANSQAYQLRHCDVWVTKTPLRQKDNAAVEEFKKLMVQHGERFEACCNALTEQGNKPIVDVLGSLPVSPYNTRSSGTRLSATSSIHKSTSNNNSTASGGGNTPSTSSKKGPSGKAIKYPSSVNHERYVIFSHCPDVPIALPTPPPSPVHIPSVTLMEKQYINYQAVCAYPYPSPSSAYCGKDYVAIQQHPHCPVLNGEYVIKGTPMEQAPPIELFHYAFAHFRGLLAKKDEDVILPTQTYEDMTQLILHAAFINPGHELERQQVTRKLLDAVLKANFLALGTQKADHVRLAERDKPPKGVVPIIICEEKAEDGDALGQAAFSWLQSSMQQPATRDSCLFPAFIISIAGTNLKIGGTILTGNPVSQNLSHGYYLTVPHQLEKDVQVKETARVLGALCESANLLVSWYQTIEILPYEKRMHRLHPLANQYLKDDDDRTPVKFEYVDMLKPPFATCTIFLARECGSNRQIVVKFVSSYSAEAHQALASAGRAPELLYCGPVWNEFEPSSAYNVGCPYQMVVMEYVEGDKLEDVQISERQRVIDAVQHALSIFHEKGFVHGDIRMPNVIVAKGEDGSSVYERVKILDFDWAGKKKEARYPPDLSNKIAWADGTESSGLIEPEHDVHMARQLYG